MHQWSNTKKIIDYDNTFLFKELEHQNQLLKKLSYESFWYYKNELCTNLLKFDYDISFNISVSQIRNSKLEHYRKFFNDNMKNSKQIWIGFKETISLKTKNKVNKLSLDIDRQKVIAESLITFPRKFLTISSLNFHLSTSHIEILWEIFIYNHFF